LAHQLAVEKVVCLVEKWVYPMADLMVVLRVEMLGH
jgi:hypothetical protein